MISEIALLTFTLMASSAAEGPGLLIAADKKLETSVRLVETDDEILFWFSGPDTVAPAVSIDVQRNGAVDRNVDFQVSVEPGDTPCLSYLIDESSSSTCRPTGTKAAIEQTRVDPAMITIIKFPKSEVSGDGFGFGFAVRVWSMTGHYGTYLASGDYRFGGKISLIGDGPNFQGDRKPNIPSPMLSALRLYQGCVNRAIDALAPFDRSMVQQVRALPVTCAKDRSNAFAQGVEALVASGTARNEASEMMRSSLDDYDLEIGRMAETIEKGG